MSARALICRIATAVALVGLCAPADAQSADQPSFGDHAMLIGVGPNWSGGYAIGDSVARLRTNATGSQPPPFTLFSASSTIESLGGLQASVAYGLTRSLLVEAEGSFSRPNIAVAISQDPEGTAQSIDGEKLHQIVLSGGVVWRLPFSFGRNVSPFVTTGVGYLRQLHEARTLVETGRVFYVGAGTHYFITGGSGTGRSIGVRGDVRATWRSNGIDFENKTRLYPSVAVAVFLGL